MIGFSNSVRCSSVGFGMVGQPCAVQNCVKGYMALPTNRESAKLHP